MLVVVAIALAAGSVGMPTPLNGAVVASPSGFAIDAGQAGEEEEDPGQVVEEEGELRSALMTKAWTPAGAEGMPGWGRPRKS